MSNFISEENIQSFKEKGYTIIKNIIPKPHRIARSIIKEVKEVVFTSDEDQEVITKLEEKEIDPLLLLVDNKLREKYLENPKSIWFNGNTRTPKISKNNGLINISQNIKVRDNILFNEDIYRVICQLYTVLTGKEEDCVYPNGPDRVCVKPKGATHMPKHIDCDIICYKEKEEEENKTSQTCPLSMYRVQTVTCLQIDTKAKNNGRTEVLGGYNNYFHLGAYYFRKIFQNKTEVPVVVQEVFSKHLDEFLEYVDSFYKKGKLLSREKTPLKKERKLYQIIYDSLPKEQIEIAWVQPQVNPGDIFCFDQRLPHRNTKNDSDIARVASFVSLYPKSYLLDEDTSLYKLFISSSDLEKKYFKDIWDERISFEVTPIVKKVLNIK